MDKQFNRELFTVDEEKFVKMTKEFTDATKWYYEPINSARVSEGYDEEGEKRLFLKSKSSHLLNGNGKQSLPTVDIKTYPNLPSLESAKSFTVPFGDMKESIEQTLFAAGDNDEASLAKGCAFSLEVEKGEMKAFALDGFRVACRKTKIADDSVSFKAKLPKNVLLELAKSNTKDDENVIVSYDKRNIIFDINNSRVIGRLYGGNIFDVDALTEKITKDNTVTFNVNTSEFQDAVDSLIPLCTATEKTIVVKFTKNEIEFSIATALGTAKVSVEAKSNAEAELVMGFNINYLLEAVGAVESEDFEMTVGNAYNPINILDGKANFITLPVRIKTAA